jgi:tetratricopeptide (TPR) repeat protein
MVPAFFLCVYLIALKFITATETKLKKRSLLLLLLVLSFYACHRKNPPAKLILTADYQKAEALYDTQKDSSFFYYNKVANSSRDSLQVAFAYNGMAELQSDAGDYFGSQENLTTSLKFLNAQKKTDFSCLTADYNELGMTSLKLKHYEAAIGYYDQAIRFTKDPEEQATVHNNQANVYQDMHNYAQALALYRVALALVPTEGKTYARILTNMAFTQWLKTPAYEALPALQQALAIRRKLKDLWGQNGSYAHLADYYMVTRPDSALYYARELHRVARQINSPNDQLDALQKLIRLGPVREARPNFFAFKTLTDSIQAAHDLAKNQFALIRYESEKNKTENLQLQTENTEKKFQLTGLVLLLIICLIVAMFWYRKIRWNAKERLLKLSQKVHDVVANGIYRVMSEVEHGKAIDKEHLLDQLEIMYERSRDITYEDDQPLLTDFALEVETLLNAFKSGGIKLGVDGNDNRLWKAVGAEVKQALRPVLQELMVNMSKHSQATQALIGFEYKGRDLIVEYRDNGIGFPATMLPGNGLRNTGNRIRTLNGSIKFAGGTASGAHIQIMIPLT